MLWQYQQAEETRNQKKKTKKKIKKQIQRNKTEPGAKNHKTQTQKSQMEKSLEVLSWRGCYLSSCGSGLLRDSSNM